MNVATGCYPTCRELRETETMLSFSVESLHRCKTKQPMPEIRHPVARCAPESTGCSLPEHRRNGRYGFVEAVGFGLLEVMEANRRLLKQLVMPLANLYTCTTAAKWSAHGS